MRTLRALANTSFFMANNSSRSYRFYMAFSENLPAYKNCKCSVKTGRVNKSCCPVHKFYGRVVDKKKKYYYHEYMTTGQFREENIRTPKKIKRRGLRSSLVIACIVFLLAPLHQTAYACPLTGCLPLKANISSATSKPRPIVLFVNSDASMTQPKKAADEHLYKKTSAWNNAVNTYQTLDLFGNKKYDTL